MVFYRSTGWLYSCACFLIVFEMGRFCDRRGAAGPPCTSRAQRPGPRSTQQRRDRSHVVPFPAPSLPPLICVSLPPSTPDGVDTSLPQPHNTTITLPPQPHLHHPFFSPFSFLVRASACSLTCDVFAACSGLVLIRSFQESSFYIACANVFDQVGGPLHSG